MREQYGPVTKEQRPERFGNYDIIRPIDTGGMGEVYLARQRSAFGRPVAIKIIRSDLVHDLTARARFLREAEVSAHLKHEHILPLFEFGEDQGRLFLVTPYIEGGTLARRLRSGPMQLAEVRQLFVPLVQAVAYIHRRGVIHRDLKPTNILLDEQDGQVYVRLIDFGIASLQGNEASPPLTMAGHEVGTIAYMAPERLNGVAAPSNDIFSLGVMLHQMLTGNLPMGDQIDDMPDPMKYVVSRCIALRPEDRFATADEVLRAFERAYQLIVSPPLPGSARLSLPLDGSMLSRASTIANTGSASYPPEMESVSLEQVEQLPGASPDLPVGQLPPETAAAGAAPIFSPADYSAPTTSFDPSRRQPPQFVPPSSQPSSVSSTSSWASPQPSSQASSLSAPGPVAAVAPSAPAARAGRQGRKRSLLPLLSAIMIVLLLVIAFLAYYGIQTITATAVTVNFAPQVKALSYKYTITATTSAQSVDVNSATIPVRGFTANQTGSTSGQTTGQVNCVFGVFGCQPGVSQADVDRLSSQERPGLQASLAQKLQQQVAGAGGTKIEDIKFSDVTITPDPAVGQPAKTVTVMLVEQASIVYYVNADAQSVARQRLARQVQQLGPGFVLVNSTVEIGQPVVKSIDAVSGKVILNIAAGGDVVYRFTSAQLKAIQSSLRGRTVKDARAFLARQQGIDVNSISIHFTRGNSNTLPGDIQKITIVPVDASSYPAIHLEKATAATTP